MNKKTVFLAVMTALLYGSTLVYSEEKSVVDSYYISFHGADVYLVDEQGRRSGTGGPNGRMFREIPNSIVSEFLERTDCLVGDGDLAPECDRGYIFLKPPLNSSYRVVVIPTNDGQVDFHIGHHRDDGTESGEIVEEKKFTKYFSRTAQREGTLKWNIAGKKYPTLTFKK